MNRSIPIFFLDMTTSRRRVDSSRPSAWDGRLGLGGSSIPTHASASVPPQEAAVR